MLYCQYRNSHWGGKRILQPSYLHNGITGKMTSLYWIRVQMLTLNTLRPKQNGRHFADDTFKPIFLNENIRISNKISLKFVPKVPINNIPALVQIMAWRRPGHKPLSEPTIVSLPTSLGLNELWCWRKNIPALGINTMPADALAPKVARASAGMVLAV